MLERGRGACHTEERKSAGVKDVDRAPIASQDGGRQERDQPGAAGDGEIPPVAERCRRDADQQVAGNAAGESDRDREHHNAEDVKACADGGEAAAETEYECPNEVEDKQERGVEAVQDGRGTRDGRHNEETMRVELGVPSAENNPPSGGPTPNGGARPWRASSCP